MAVMQRFNLKMEIIIVINLLFVQMEYIPQEKKPYSLRIHLRNQIIQERFECVFVQKSYNTHSTTHGTTQDIAKWYVPIPWKGFCVYYGLMSEYPDTMKYPSVYEMDCIGELVMIMPLVNNEALFVLLHSRSKQDDPNAWSYSCTVDGKFVSNAELVRR